MQHDEASISRQRVVLVDKEADDRARFRGSFRFFTDDNIMSFSVLEGNRDSSYKVIAIL
jgi:hypothetical protein